MVKNEKLLWLSLIGLITFSVAIGLYSSLNQRGGIDPFWQFGTDPVNKIVISGKSAKVELLFESGIWSVGDSLRANQDRIAVLLAAVTRAQGRRIASAEEQKFLAELSIKQGVQVEIFSGQKRLSRFTAVGNDEKKETWLLQDGGVPVQVAIPGYRTFLFSAFETNPNRWKDLRIFDFNWRNFSGFKAEFPQQFAENFSIDQADGWFGISGLERSDTSRINSYLDAVSLLKADEFRATSGPLLDSLQSISPRAILAARETSGVTHRLKLYEQGLAVLNDREVLFFGRSKRALLLTGRSTFRLKSN